METIIMGYIGIMEKKRETTVWGLGLKVGSQSRML